MDLGALPYLKWSSLQQLVMVGLTTNGQQYLHVAVVTRPYLQPKLKSDKNGYALEGASNTISCFVDMFLHSFENTDYFSLRFCFILKINYKNENWYNCRFHLLGFY